MVWRTPANNTPRLSSVIVASCCVQTNCPWHVKIMDIVPVHEWKVTLKYQGMELGQVAGRHHGVGVGGDLSMAVAGAKST